MTIAYADHGALCSRALQLWTRVRSGQCGPGLPRQWWRQIRLRLQHTINERHRRTLDHGAGTAGLPQQVHEIQNQRLAGMVAGERPQRMRCPSPTMSLMPGHGEFDDDPGPAASRLPGSRPETDGCGGEPVTVRARSWNPDRQVAEAPAASGRGAKRAVQAAWRPPDAGVENRVHDRHPHYSEMRCQSDCRLSWRACSTKNSWRQRPRAWRNC